MPFLERLINLKVIYVILDGLNAETAFRTMGFMEHLVEIGISKKYMVKAELPTVSRPLYEVLLTGVPVYEHETFSNVIQRPSKEESLFTLAREKGLVTAAAAYHWVSELYNKSPFLPADRFQLDVERPIQHGIFYYEDMYPDSHLFTDAEFLRVSYQPDLLIIHSMNIDYAGHVAGGDSNEYSMAAIKADMILSHCVKTWIRDGYAVVVTADHGMTSAKMHNGTTDQERIVPLYIAGINTKVNFAPGEKTVPQLALAPLICDILAIEKSKKMMNKKIIEIGEG